MTPYMRAANVTWNGVDVSDVKEMDFTPKEQAVYRLEDGDVLLSEASGSAAEVGKPAIWRDEIPGACFQNTLIRVRSKGPLPEFLHYHFLNDAKSGRFATAGKGIGINHLGADRMSSWPLTLPPIDVQRRIVAKLDELLAQSRAAREQLEAVPALVEQYRQSVLAAAFRGDLTADWRKKNPDVEPASKLIERIRIERRQKWEAAELAKLKAKGKSPKDDKWKSKYVEPAPVDASDLPELPSTWCWARWSEIASSQNGRPFPSGDYTNRGIRLLRPGNLHVSGDVRWTTENTKCMPERYADENDGWVVGANQLVMNLTAQSLKDEFLGRICMTGNDERCLLNQRIAWLKPTVVPTRFAFWLLKCFGRSETDPPAGVKLIHPRLDFQPT
ncbi:MAG: hypothetical protein DI536_33805, partial [Archangium gephyra]